MAEEYIAPDSCVLAIDQGGHSSRAIAFDFQGVHLAEASRPIQTVHGDEDRVEHDPQQVLQSVREAVAECVIQAGAAGRRIVAAGIATQRSSLVCWNRDTGEALSPVISWQDRRGADWLRSLDLNREDIHRLTGLFVTAHYGASKFRWCLDNIPDVAQAQADGRLAMGPLASFLIFHLLRERPLLVDPANASRTQLWNLQSRDWEPALLSRFGLRREEFPKCVSSRHSFGSLPIGDAEVPLTIVTGDQSASLFAFGRIQPATAYVNIGTGGFVSRPAGHYPSFGRRLLTSIIHAEDHEPTYVLEGTVNGAASAIDWAAETLDIPDIYDRLEEFLETETDPPLFLNGVSGLGAPFWVADFHSRFVGEGGAPAHAAAVAESIVFLLEANMREMLKFASRPEQIQLTGGMASYDGLCQRIADLGGLPVYRPRELEATARGLAYLVAGMPRNWPEPGFGDWFKPRENPNLRSRYERWMAEMLKGMRDAGRPRG
jgi:glycerol kinase